MLKCNTSTVEAQVSRLEIKTQLHQLQIVAEHGAGLSPWEASSLAAIVEETIFQSAEAVTYRSGQLKYSCVKMSEPTGKPLDQCGMVAVRLTLFDAEDHRELPSEACGAAEDVGGDGWKVHRRVREGAWRRASAKRHDPRHGADADAQEDHHQEALRPAGDRPAGHPRDMPFGSRHRALHHLVQAGPDVPEKADDSGGDRLRRAQDAKTRPGIS